MTSSPSTPTPTTTTTTTTCRYAGKKCANERAVKRNGALHNLCHYHRVRANQNQRRMELRRRVKRSREDRDAAAAAGSVSVRLPVAYAGGVGSSKFVNCASPVDGYSALLRDALVQPTVPHLSQTQSFDSAVAAATWGYYADLPPAHNALLSQSLSSLSSLSSSDHLSELFSAVVPERSHFLVDLPHVSSRSHKSLDSAEEPCFQFALSPVSPSQSTLLGADAAMGGSFNGRSFLDLFAFPQHPQTIWCDQELLL